VIKSGEQWEMQVHTERGGVAKAQVSPFSGTYRKKGAIITVTAGL
jgi:hypothetical protein